MSRFAWMALQSLIIGVFVLAALSEEFRNNPQAIILLPALGCLIAEAVTLGLTRFSDWGRSLSQAQLTGFVIVEAASMVGLSYWLAQDMPNGAPSEGFDFLILLPFSALFMAILTPAIVLSWRTVAPVILKRPLRDVGQPQRKPACIVDCLMPLSLCSALRLAYLELGKPGYKGGVNPALYG